MIRSKTYNILILFVVLILTSCSDSFLSKANYEFNEAKQNFTNQCKTSNLFSHFPKKLTKDYLKMFSAPPSKRGVNYTGYMYLIFPLDKPGKEVKNVLNRKFLLSSDYIDVQNIIINLSELKRNIFPIKKCNQWIAHKYPIPYFESFDFGLGEKEEQKKINGETHYNYTYTIPSDLKVYVIKAEAGDFWKKNCNEVRPKSLKEWEHGYSTGIATSDKENIIVYWTMIW